MKNVWKKGLAALCAAAMLMTVPGICVLADETEPEEIIVSEAEQIPEETWAALESEKKTIEEAVEGSEEEPAPESAQVEAPAEIPEEESPDISYPEAICLYKLSLRFAASPQAENELQWIESKTGLSPEDCGEDELAAFCEQHDIPTDLSQTVKENLEMLKLVMPTTGTGANE